MDILNWIIPIIIAIFGGIGGILINRAWKNRDRKNQKDKEILDEIRGFLDDDTMLVLRTQDFMGTFDWDHINGLKKFMMACERPDFIFLDKKLEKMRIQLLETITKFDQILGANSFRVDIVGSKEARIPKEWEFEQPEKFQSLRLEVNELANQACEIHAELVKKARQKL